MERYILANLEREFGGVKPMNNIEILEDLKKYISFANKQCNFSNDTDYKWHKELAGMIENLIQENKELKDTLKQTQDSWYEDTKKIELNNECEIALNNRILDLEQENKELKEKNKELEKYDYRKIKLDEKDKISSIHFTQEQLDLMNLGIALYVGIPKILADKEDEETDI